VYIDAAVLALHLAADPRYVPLTRVVLGGIRDGEFEARTSAISVYQLLAEPYRSGHDSTAVRVEMLLSALPGLKVVALSATIAGQAAQVKAQVGGSLTRAIHIATGLAGDSELFVTRRSALRRIAGLGIEQLDAYVGVTSEPGT
jgi:hypothetical protein